MEQQKFDAVMQRESPTRGVEKNKIDNIIDNVIIDNISYSTNRYLAAADTVNKATETLKNNIIYIDRAEAEARKIKSRNKALNGEYNNELERREELIEAIDWTLSVPSGQIQEWIEEPEKEINSTENILHGIAQRNFDVIKKQVASKTKGIGFNLTAARGYAYKLYSNTKTVIVALAVVSIILMLGFIIAACIISDLGIISDFIGLFYTGAAVFGLLFIIFLCVNSSYSKKIEQTAQRLNLGWRAIAEKYINKRVIWKGLEIDAMYKTLAEQGGAELQGKVEKRINESLLPAMQKYEEAKNEYLKLRSDPKFEDILNTVNGFDNICADFINIISPEFRDSDKLADICDLLKAKRADNLKEAYTILEVRYREDARDEELRNFHRIQNSEAIAQTQAQLLTAKITQHNGEVQAYYARR